MQHYVELETAELILEEERSNPEEDTTGDFQCADSLAIAVNRIGGEGFGVKKLLRNCARALTRTDGRATLTQFLSAQ